MEGVETKFLETYNDERGFFREVIRATDRFFRDGISGNSFGQISHTKMNHGVIKAWHLHQVQTDWWYVPVGSIKAVLRDCREHSKTFKHIEEHLMGEDYYPPIVLKIPPGVAHGLKVINGPAVMFYVTSHIYNPEDEKRIKFWDFDYDWLKQKIA